MTAKHAYRGTMKALQELGLKSKNNNIKTVDDVAKQLQAEGSSSPEILNLNNNIIKIEPSKICNWEFHDRNEFELGDIDALANDLKINGQQQPCIVRPYKGNNSSFEYELIVGERRWRAATKAKIKLEALIKNLDDQEAALCQVSENAHRKDLSDYSKGINYSKLIEHGILKPRDLEVRLGLSQAQISRLLSFHQVPQIIWDAIGDMSKVTARTAADIRSFANKGQKYIDALIHLSPKIRNGKMGAATLQNEIEAYLNLDSSKQLISAEEIKSINGRHLFTWRKDSNNNISISFPKDIRTFIDKDKLEIVIKENIESQLEQHS